jgi:hypothetical protein
MSRARGDVVAPAILSSACVDETQDDRAVDKGWHWPGVDSSDGLYSPAVPLLIGDDAGGAAPCALPTPADPPISALVRSLTQRVSLAQTCG